MCIHILSLTKLYTLSVFMILHVDSTFIFSPRVLSMQQRHQVKSLKTTENYTHRKLLFCLFDFSRATPVAHGSSQARGLIGAVATSLCQSHSNAGSELHLQPTPQLTAMPDL